VRSLEDNEALGIIAWRGNRERTSTLEAPIRMGAINDGMRNICELLLNVVSDCRLKVLESLDQHGKRYGWNVYVSFHVIDDSSGG
jgi:hypothetical protein